MANINKKIRKTEEKIKEAEFRISRFQEDLAEARKIFDYLESRKEDIRWRIFDNVYGEYEKEIFKTKKEAEDYDLKNYLNFSIIYPILDGKNIEKYVTESDIKDILYHIEEYEKYLVALQEQLVSLKQEQAAQN